jgi:predicted HicB family RNase H-like nuclease
MGRDNMAERRTFSVRIDPAIWKAARMLAVERDTTLSDLVEEAIQELIKKSGDESKKSSKK